MHFFSTFWSETFFLTCLWLVAKGTFSSISCAEDKLNVKGLGSIKGQKRIDQMTKREHRSSVPSLTKDISENPSLSPCMAWQNKQGRFLGWETAIHMDTRWNRLLYSWSPDLLQFYLNATQDTLPSSAANLTLKVAKVLSLPRGREFL